MKEFNGIKFGEVFSLTYGDTLRVLFLDDISIFFCRNGVLDKKELKKHYVLPRLPLNYFLKNSSKIDFIPLTSEELSTIQPDLPLRFLRAETFDWDKPNFNVFSDISGFLEAVQIYIYSVTTSGRPGKFILIESEEGIIPFQKILETAYLAQKEYKTKIQGFGIYRTGFKNFIPTFYVGGYHDAAGHTYYVG